MRSLNLIEEYKIGWRRRDVGMSREETVSNRSIQKREHDR